MFGARKKLNLKDDENRPTKKQWQIELEAESDEAIPADIEIPKNIYEDEDQENKDIEKEGVRIFNILNNINLQDNEGYNADNEPVKAESSKQKAFDWMTSEDENYGI